MKVKKGEESRIRQSKDEGQLDGSETNRETVIE